MNPLRTTGSPHERPYRFCEAARSRRTNPVRPGRSPRYRIRVGHAVISARLSGHTPRSSLCEPRPPQPVAGRGWPEWQRAGTNGQAPGRSCASWGTNTSTSTTSVSSRARPLERARQDVRRRARSDAYERRQPVPCSRWQRDEARPVPRCPAHVRCERGWSAVALRSRCVACAGCSERASVAGRDCGGGGSGR
jgi:hypothetical protein